MAERGTGDADLVREDAVEIANEFGLVRVAKVRTRNGERLEIHSPRRDSVIRLDPLELESLSEQDPEFFARLVGHQPTDKESSSG